MSFQFRVALLLCLSPSLRIEASNKYSAASFCRCCHRFYWCNICFTLDEILYKKVISEIVPVFIKFDVVAQLVFAFFSTYAFNWAPERWENISCFDLHSVAQKSWIATKTNKLCEQELLVAVFLFFCKLDCLKLFYILEIAKQISLMRLSSKEIYISIWNIAVVSTNRLSHIIHEQIIWHVKIM